MTEYDAFGRKIGEDTLEALRDAPPVEQVDEPAEASSEAAPAVSVMGAGSPPPGAGSGPAHAHTGRSAMPEWVPKRRWLIGPVVLLVVAGAAGLGVYSLFETGREVKGVIDVVRDVADDQGELPAIPDIPGVPDAGVPTAPETDAPGPAPQGLGGASLIGSARFAEALRALRREQRGRALSLTLRPERIDVQFVLGDGRIRVMQVTPGPSVRTIVTTGGGFSGVPAASLRGLDTGAPERLARAGARLVRQPASRVDYVTFANLTGEPGWVVYFKNGRYVVGDARGNAVRAYP